ncbi:MAG TPA: ABC transporter substrate-binding protein [Pseudonocardiaceae bacterium]|nr:ABC transporter substrate-binding protein [Pseudonocardiaceae bacterium]
MTTGNGSRTVRVGACLSLSGRYARFGRQAARALEIWRSMYGIGDLTIEDDRSDPNTLASVLPRVAANCDIVLGPYSTQLMKRAGRIAADGDFLLWNHGGSGDDIEAAYPGHVVSVPTPTRSYAIPYVQHLANDAAKQELRIVRGKGSFGRQVAAGAEQIALDLGFDTVHSCTSDELAQDVVPENWDMLSAGTFEDDVEIVRRATMMAHPPKRICSIAAGVREFGNEVKSTEGTFGIAQWFPGAERKALLGPTEHGFVEEYRKLANEVPDYPAVQAIAAAVIAVHCVVQAGGVSRELLWPTAAHLNTETLFGRFAIDQVTGAQVGHETTLVRWAGGGPGPVNG